MVRYLTGRVEISMGDITRLRVDAIVNAANPSLLGGGGVDGAIHRAAGPRLREACRELGGARPGEAKMTPGFDLPARHVIHAVGPVWSGGDEGEDAVLAGTYRRSLELADAAGLDSIAFPAISMGAYRFPIERATRIAQATVADWLRTHDLPRRVIFCTHNELDHETYERIAEELLVAAH